MAIWHPESGIKYGEYLQANSFVRDITGQIKSNDNAFKASISQQTQQIIASNQELARTFGDGFDTINNTIEWGLENIEQSMRDYNRSIEAFRSDFNYNMGLMLQELQVQNNLLWNLIDRLDSIHNILERPTLTQAREFYRIGCERLSRGLLDKALEAFTEAEKKNDTDFFTQYQIGKLYLYGVDEDDNLLDLDKARKHLLLAVRYAKAELNIDKSFAKLAAEALLHASIAIYAELGEEQISTDADKRQTLLTEARQLSMDAAKLYPQFLEALFHTAKYSSLLGDTQLCINHLEEAISGDRKYAVKVSIDQAFDPMRDPVSNLLSKFKELKKDESKIKLKQAEDLVNDLSLWHLEDSSALNLVFEKCKSDILLAKNHNLSDTYFGYLDSIKISETIISDYQSLRSDRIKELKNQIIKTVAETNKKLLSLKYISELFKELADFKHISKKNRNDYIKRSQDIDADILETSNLLSNIEDEVSSFTNYEVFESAIIRVNTAYKYATSSLDTLNEESARESAEKKKKEYLELIKQKRIENSNKDPYSTIGARWGGIIGFIISIVSCADKFGKEPFTGGSYPILYPIIGIIIGVIIGALIGFIADQLKE